ncbi:hypothetical protein T12_3999 [Trichinella patagoniensis]|uniref:Uncharacterized protein n=1 Tax=Trichinella patagoniensis TaxID=990121 RepID=A0A0V0YWM8_9BILA|nr:hypothetical protein T12_3999 [Trichinella patagoniensis]
MHHIDLSDLQGGLPGSCAYPYVPDCSARSRMCTSDWVKPKASVLKGIFGRSDMHFRACLPGKGTLNGTILSGRSLMTPTPGFHAYPGFYITERVFGYTPDCRV